MNKNLEATRLEPAIVRLPMKEGKTPDLSDYIRAFDELPDLLLSAKGILVVESVDPVAATLLQNLRVMAVATRQWIEHFQQNDNQEKVSDPPELSSCWKKHHKLIGQDSWMLLKLCKAILERDPFNWTKPPNNVSFNELWFSFEWERLEQNLQRMGFLDRGNHLSKQKACDELSRRLKEDFDSLHQRKFVQPGEIQPTKIHVLKSTQNAVLRCAEMIAQNDIHFIHSIYKPYIDVKKRIIRYIRNTKEFQLCYISYINEKEELKIGGKGKRGKGKKKSEKKGFK